MDNDIVAELTEIANMLEKAQNILVVHDKLCRIAEPDMEVSEWNQTPNGRVIRLIGNAIEMIDALEV